MPVHERLDLGRPYLVPRGIDHALEAIRDEEIAILILITNISRAQKPLSVNCQKRVFGGIFALPVPLKNLRTMHHDFALLSVGYLKPAIEIDDPRIDADEGDTQALQLWRIARIHQRNR